MKRNFLLAMLLIATIIITGLPVSERANAQEKSDALFLQSITASKSEDSFSFDFKFGVSVASAESELDEKSKKMFSVNGTALSDIANATLTYYESSEDFYSIRAVVSADAVSTEDKNTVNITRGFTSETEFITTVQYNYNFSAFKGDGSWQGTRVYRSNNMDDFETVRVTSVSLPNVQSGNMFFAVNFSDIITPKKLIDLQVRTARQLKEFHGDNGDNIFTNEMIDMYDRYGMLFANNSESLMYKLWIGGDKYNNLQAFPYNNSGRPYDMTPKANVEGIDLYNIYQFQEQTADATIYFKDDSGKMVLNSGSSQPLVVQLHLNGNTLEIVLKGDSIRKATEFYDSTKTNKIDRTSFNENIIPSDSDRLAVHLEAGMLFPNGRMLKESVSFYYSPEKSTWFVAGTETPVPEPDLTLTNQEGYTDEEIAKIKQSGETGFGSIGKIDIGSAVNLFGFCGAFLCASRKKFNSKGESII